MTRPCECAFIPPGWCPRHKMMKGRNQKRLCETREDYRAYWDQLAEGKLPGQQQSQPRKSRSIPKEGPGTELKKLLLRFGIRETEDCGCGDLANAMNLNGSQWCLNHADEIAEWMIDQASERKVLGKLTRLSRRGAKHAAKRLIRIAVWLYERKQKRRK